MVRIKVGISSCLLGEEVRFNGGHKKSRLCTDELSEFFDYMPLCPEVGAGMGVPRKPIRLVASPQSPRAVQTDDPDQDFTEALKSFANRQQAVLNQLSGYIFMKDSPSCGVFRVKVYRDNGNPFQEAGTGIFARQVMELLPLLPVEESGRLVDPVLRENFITRVFAYEDWRQLSDKGITAAGIVDFHSRYKYTLMAHDPVAYQMLGRMVAAVGKEDPLLVGERYFSGLMVALTKKATRRTHTNVLMHLQGYLKKHLHSREKIKLAEVIEQYRKGVIPLIVPITLLKHHFNNHPDEYIARQAYLQPYPEELSLRNQI